MSTPTAGKDRRPAAMGGLIVLALLLLGPARSVDAAPARITLELDRHIAAVGEEIGVTVEILVEGQGSYERYQPPTFAGFQVSSGGMSSQNIEVINWQVRRRERYTYGITPLREGTFTVGPAAIQMGGRLIRSATASVKVKKGSAPAAPPPAEVDQPDLPADPGGRTLLISATLSAPRVYQGQEVIASWQLLTQHDIVGFQSALQPTTDSFWSEDLRTPQRLEFERRMVGDSLYLVAMLARKALFPQKPGKLTVGPMEARVRMLQGFSSSSVTVRSEPLVLEVLPLPEKGRPPGFPEANVGEFDLAASLDREAVKAGDAVTLRLVIRGRGNLGGIKLPALERLEGFRVYEPKASDRFDLENGVEGEKVLEVLLMPTRSGALTLPAIHLDYFDPRAGVYKRASSAPLSLTVKGQMPASVTGPAGEGTRNVIGPSIRPPRPARSMRHREAAPVERSALFWSLLVLPVGMLLLVSGGERLRARLSRETPARIRRAAARRTTSHLRRAEEHRRAGEAPGVFGEIAAALHSQLDGQLGIRSEGMTRVELGERLAAAGLKDELCQGVLGELDNCDFARFAPSASGQPQMEEALARARRLLDRLARTVLRREARA